MGSQHSADEMEVEAGDIYRLDHAIDAIFLHGFTMFDSLETLGRLASTRNKYHQLLVKHKEEIKTKMVKLRILPYYFHQHFHNLPIDINGFYYWTKFDQQQNLLRYASTEYVAMAHCTANFFIRDDAKIYIYMPKQYSNQATDIYAEFDVSYRANICWMLIPDEMKKSGVSSDGIIPGPQISLCSDETIEYLKNNL